MILIDKRIIIQYVPLATRYKDEWAIRAIEAWRSNRATMAQNVFAAFRSLCSTCRLPSSIIRYHFLKLEVTALVWFALHNDTIYALDTLFIDIRKRDGLATLLLSIFYLQLSTPEANIAQLAW